MAKIKLRERKYRGKLNYLFFNNSSDTLLIVFSAFSGDRRRYNYVKGLNDLKVDKLYILDPFGFRGSYNLYENGTNIPEKLTMGLIESVLSKRKYKHVYTAGSSKGGTCAIYFGLKFNVEAIFSGACQYNIGSYVHRPDHEKIFLGMMGEGACENEAKMLNSIMPTVLEENKETKTQLHILYSKKELTYQRQIVDLLHKLKECNIPYLEIEEQFDKHDDVGIYFLAYLKKFFHIE